MPANRYSQRPLSVDAVLLSRSEMWDAGNGPAKFHCPAREIEA